jgi:hypothetical protein
MGRAAATFQRIVLRTERGPLRLVWRLGFALLERAYVMALRGRESGATIYLRDSRAPTLGLSDVDPVVIVPLDPHGQGEARNRVLTRRARLERLAPRLCATLFDSPRVFEGTEADRVQPAQMHDGAPLYTGANGHADRARLAERPDLYGHGTGWRLAAGRARPLEAGPSTPEERRLTGWLSLQASWRWLLQSAPEPSGPRWADLCVKAVADPARIWLWLALGERTDGRRGTLERALSAMPEHERALRAAIDLERRIASAPANPEFAAHAVAMAGAVADLITRELDHHGHDDVRLVDDGELTLPRNPAWRLASVSREPRLVPLVDWRALCGAWLIGDGVPPPAPPDETLAPVGLDPANLGELRTAVLAGDAGPYPALRSGPLLVLASRPWSRTQLRAVQCAATDPVSFALLDRHASAGYPAVAGWSADHTAGRAVSESAPRLATGNLPALVTAARAALFLLSVRDGEPTLTITASATLRALADHCGGSPAAVDEAREALRCQRLGTGEPPRATVDALRSLVAGLPPYRTGPRPVGARGGSAGTAGI